MARMKTLTGVSSITILLIIISTGEIASSQMIDGIGVNWGTMASHPMIPSIVAQMLKDNGIKKVKLFDADQWTLSGLAGSNIEVMLAIPNDQLGHMSDRFRHARRWVDENVTKHINNVNIKYVAVGNEPFLQSYNGSFVNITLPALKNIQNALGKAGYGDRIKAVVPMNADVYASPPNNPVPSAGSFRKDILNRMTEIVQFLNSNNAPFIVNVYPYISLYQNPGFPTDYAFFDGNAKPLVDGNMTYTNVFDANFDTLVWSLRRAKVPNMKVVIGEVGWPTDGDKRATRENAERFYNGFFKKMANKTGTPLRPGSFDVYLFSLFDEDQKSVLPGNFERHWGLFYYDGRPKFKVDFSGEGKDQFPVGAKGVRYLPKNWCVLDDSDGDNLQSIPKSVNYACSNADCTSLGYGCSCNGMSKNSNISYAFNIYFQTMDQDVRACAFDGLGKITTSDPSQSNCSFPIQIINGARREQGRFSILLVFWLFFVFFI